MVETVLDRTDGAHPLMPGGQPSPTTPPGLPGPAEVLGRAGGENFTVASRLLPRRSRRHLLALYGWARLVDELGDAYPGDRRAALDWVEAALDAELAGSAGRARPGAAAARGPAPAAPSPLVSAAATMVRELGAGDDELRKLVAANRTDQDVHRYRTWGDLTAYCGLSADPVGRLVLLAFGASTPERVAWSDLICTGLQVAEHCQDVGEDARAGRIYLPQDDLDAFGVGDADVLAAADGDPAAAARLRGVISWETARARHLLVAGSPLVASLRGRARLAVAGFVAGGLAAVDAVAGSGYQAWGRAPAPSAARAGLHLARLLANARRGGRA